MTPSFLLFAFLAAFCGAIWAAGKEGVKLLLVLMWLILLVSGLGSIIWEAARRMA